VIVFSIFIVIVLLFGITHGQTSQVNKKMAKMNQNAVFVVVVLLLLVATFVFESGCSALDPCVIERNNCIDKCPTVVVFKQICQEKCNFQYDLCKRK